LNAHSGTWRNNVQGLSRDLRVLAPSLPPWHGSPKDLDIEPYVEDLEQFLSGLRIDRIFIVGNSMGGWIAMEIAADHPEWVRGLILEDSAGISNSSDQNLISKVDDARVPVLIIWGRDDKILPLEAGRYLHSKLKTSDLVLLDHIGHVPHWEVPDTFNRLVLDFLKREQETQSKSSK
jgi:pimeloyl-ACP methyl ester carboxylesterase